MSDEPSKIKVGDRVIWQAPPHTNKDGRRFVPIGIANCRVLEIGEAEDTGEPAARVRLPPQLGSQEANARLAELRRMDDG